MNIKVWSNFSKRRNSTKQPTGGTQINNVNLKESTSIEQPTFIIASNDFSINYVEAFGHYYFVTDIKSVRNGLIEINCDLDALATYKTAIVGSSQFIDRADMGATYVCTVPDSLNPPTDEIEIASTDIINLGWAGDPTLILGTVCNNGVAYYAMSEARLTAILNSVFNNSFSQNIQDQFYGIREYLISLKKVPYNPTGATESVYIGTYDTQDSAKRVSETVIHDNATVNINFPSDSHLNTGSYIDFPPYSMACLYLPYVGVVQLDISILGDHKQLTVDYWLDQVTADIVYKVSCGGMTLGTYSGNCGANLPIATQHYNAAGALGSLMTVIGGVAMDNPALAASGVLGAFQNFSLHSQISGTISSFIGNSVGTMVQCFVVTKVPVTWSLNQHRTRCGVPVQEQLSLSGRSGYVQCRNASVDIPGEEKDKSTIEGYMNSGFYIE